MEDNHNTTIIDQEYSDPATQRTIIDLIDVETGDCVDASMLDSMNEAELTQLKELQTMAKKSGKYKYVCAICGQPLRLDSRKYSTRRYKSYFFSHYSSESECPLKTSSDAVDPIQSTINWYGRFKESKMHRDMCKVLMEVLEKDDRFTNVESYPTINIYGENIHWHKPDVSASFYGNQIVFETLMYNTFISRIVEKNSFYRMANSFLLWIFPFFSIDNQVMQEKDIYYTHRRNIFIFDSKEYYQSNNDIDSQKVKLPEFVEEGYQYAQEESIKQGHLMLNCYWQIPVVENGKVRIEWHRKLVGIEELTYDAIRKDVFFHNSDYDFKEVADPIKRQLIEDWEHAKESRWNSVLQGLEERKKQYEITNAKRLQRERMEQISNLVNDGEVVPEPFEENGKYGYKVDDVVFIKPQYTKAFPFRKGVAIVIKRKNWGLINLKNEPIVGINLPKLTWLDINNPCLLLAKIADHCFSIYNIKGEIVFDFRIYGLKKIQCGYIIQKEDSKKIGFMSHDGKILIAPQYDKITEKGDNKIVIAYNGRSKTINIDFIDDTSYIKIVSNVSQNCYIAERMLFFGIVNAKNDILLPFDYNNISVFSEQYILVERMINDQGSKITQFALFNLNFQQVLSFTSNNIIALPNGCIRVGNIIYKEDLTTLISGYNYCDLCPDGNYIVGREHVSGWEWRKTRYTLYGLLDKEGQMIFPIIGRKISKNTKGNIVVKEELLDNGYVIKQCFGIAALFESNDSRSVTCYYDDIAVMGNGTLRVKIGIKYGIASKTGEILVPCNYNQEDFDEDGNVEGVK